MNQTAAFAISILASTLLQSCGQGHVTLNLRKHARQAPSSKPMVVVQDAKARDAGGACDVE